uniref:F-box domain-containing protein n=1 Tax=Anas platyrhynchos TaxID=8839 RepID=A0A8B9ZIF4_ANAPL
MNWKCYLLLIFTFRYYVFLFLENNQKIRVLEHVLNLCRGKYDFLDRLPVPLLQDLISFLELENIARLSQVSCRFEMVNIYIYIIYDDIGWVGMVFERSLFPTSCSVQQQVIGRMER